MHGDVFDMMGLSRTPYNKINIHIGGVYGDKPKPWKGFVRTLNYYQIELKSRLTVENDDKQVCIQLRSYIMEYTKNWRAHRV